MCPRNLVSLKIIGGMLPPGIEFDASGYFQGTPVEPGRYTFVVRASNDCGFSDHQIALEVAGAPVLAVHPQAIEYTVLFGQQALETTHLRVSSDPPDLAYSVDIPKLTWLRYHAEAGRTPAPDSALGSDLIEVKVDTTRLPPGTHRANLRFSAWRSVNAPNVPVTITVLPQPVSTMPSALPRQLEPRPLPAIQLTHSDAGLVPPARPQARSTKPTPGPEPSSSRRYAGRLSRVTASRPKQPAVNPRSPQKPSKLPNTADADPHGKPSPLGSPVARSSKSKKSAPVRKAERLALPKR
jgi:hypothetical protein